jgi:cytochrome P450
LATESLRINFFEPAVIADPFPAYEEVRSAGPVVWNEAMGMWMVPGFEDCRAVLADYGRFSNAHYRDREKVWWFEANNMVMVEPPEHHRLRNPLAPMFTRSAVAGLKDQVVRTVDELLDPLRQGGDELDIIGDFTMIPVVVLAEMIGVPEDRRQDFRRWSSTIAGSLAYGLEDPESLSRMRAASDELSSYLAEEIDRHRRDRPEDLLTAMLDQSPESGMSDAEIRSAVCVLLLAGYDTTAKLMANCLVVLDQHPDQRRRLVAHPELLPAAVEEVLRWCGVLHGVLRTVEVRTDLGGQVIEAGDIVCTLPAAANRDPGRWSAPERFDIDREAKAHLGFGYGPHLCIGAPLARLETTVALERLLGLAPEYSLSEVDYGKAWFLRGPERGRLQARATAVRV